MQLPVCERGVTTFETKFERALSRTAAREWQRFMQAVAKAGIDVPDAVRVLVRGQVVNEQDQMVRHRLSRGSVRAVDASNVQSDAITHRLQQPAQSAVDVVAVPAAPLVGAVTTRPKQAFSSLTASAKQLTQSSVVENSCPLARTPSSHRS